MKQIAKVQPLVIENAKDYSDDKNSLNLYYGYQRVLYIISDKYLEGTKEGEEYKKTALAEMIKLKEQYEKLTGEKVTIKTNSLIGYKVSRGFTYLIQRLPSGSKYAY